MFKILYPEYQTVKPVDLLTSFVLCIDVVGCGGMWWDVVGGMWWYVVVCGGMWWEVMGCGRMGCEVV